MGDNASKDMLNERAAVSFSLATGSESNWIYSADYHRGKLIQDPRLLEEICTYNSGQTGYQLNRLPLCSGMPVIMCQNYEVDLGIVNGSIGIVEYARYVETEPGRQRAKSCIVKFPGYLGRRFPELEDKEVAVLEDSVDLTFTHPHSGKKCTTHRHQLPLFPAFAIAVYKAQGLTFQMAVVDLESCLGIEAAYVMVSRVRSIEGLMILRPFRGSKITARQSEDSRRELRRLRLFHLQTISKHAVNQAEREDALQELRSFVLPALPEDGDTVNPATVLREYQETNSNIPLELEERVITGRSVT